jgi:hypothetical protein
MSTTMINGLAAGTQTLLYPDCGSTKSYADFLNTRGNRNRNGYCNDCTETHNQTARTAGFADLSQELFEYVRDNRSDLKQFLPNKGNKIALKPLYKYLVKIGEIKVQDATL